MSFWSSATDPKSDSWSKCQDTSSTTAVWPVKMVLASTTFPSFGTALMSHRQTVYRAGEMKNITSTPQINYISFPQIQARISSICYYTGVYKLKYETRFFSYVVIWCTQQRARKIWIPWEPVAFLLVTPETQIWATLSRRICCQCKK